MWHAVSARDSVSSGDASRPSLLITNHDTHESKVPQGMNRVMNLINVPVKVRRARCLKRFISADEFEVSMVFNLEAVPARKTNIAMLALADCLGGFLPRFDVLPPVLQVRISSASCLMRIRPNAAIFVSCSRQHGADVPLFKTKLYEGPSPSDPVWDHDAPFVVPEVHSDEALEFKVVECASHGDHRGKHVVLAKGLLSLETIDGFEGDIPLSPARTEGRVQADDIQDSAWENASLHVKVSQARGSCLSVSVSAGEGQPVRRLDPVDIEVGETMKIKFELFRAESRESSLVGHTFSDDGGYNIAVSHVDVTDGFKHKMRHEVAFPQLKIPKPTRLLLYASGPEDRPAAAMVSKFQYWWQTKEGLFFQKDDERVTFKIPEEDKKVLAMMAEEMEASKTWRRFDAFFGFFLVANCVLIGVEINMNESSPGQVSEETWRMVELSFLIVFTTEFALRLIVAGSRLWRQRNEDQPKKKYMAVADGWLYFDGLVLLLSFGSFVIDSMDDEGVDFPVSSLRLIRLVKLIRMVRLVRAFKDLGRLIESLFTSTGFIFWTMVCLFFVLFLGAMLSSNVASAICEQEKCPNLVGRWERVTWAMWYTLVLSTSDGWGETLRELYFGVPDWKGGLMASIILLVTCVLSIGVFNMIIGLMCYTACHAEQMEVRRRNSAVLEKKQKALSNLCVLLRNFGPRPIFKSSRDISSQEFFQIISCISPVLLESDVGNDLGPLPKETQRQVIAIFNDLEVSFYDLFSLAKAFEDNGELEINGLVEGMAVLELQRFYQVRGRSVEGEIFGTQSLGVRPPDMLFFNTGLAEIERHLHGTERSILGQASIVTDILQCLNHICFEAHTLFQFDMSKLDIAQMREKALLQQSASEDKPMSIGAMVNHILEYKASLAAQGLESRIDLLAALFIVANAVTLGVEITTSTKDDKDIAFYLVNLVFTVVFSTELILRLTLRANVLDLQVEREWVSDDTDRQVDGEQDGYFYSMKSIEALRRRTLFGIFPPCPRRGCTQVCRMAPEFLTDPFTFFDAVIVLLSIMDALVLFILSAAAGFSKIRLLGLLRVLRLVRLLKLVRVLRLLPGLQKIVYVVLDASKLIRRQICLMLILCYTFGVLMEFVIDKERASPELNYYFNGILTGTITAFQLMIFDEWDIIMDVTSKEFPELVILVEIPLMIAGVMFINSVVGLFCTAAVSLVQQKQGTRRQRGYLTILQAMGELGTLLRTELTTHVVTQEMLETALGMKFRPKRKHAGRDGREATLNDRRQAESISSVNLRASSPDFIDKLRHILCKADMVPLLWKQIYEKIDYERRGYISVDLLAVGAILLRVDSEQVDIFAASTALRQVRQKVRELHKLESRVHHDLEVVVRMTNSLCHRNEDDCRVGEVRDLWSLSDKTVEAVKGLRRVLEVGTHDQMAYRNVKIKAERGRGKLRQVDEHYDNAGNPVFLLEGHATRFRRDLQIGDDILVEMDMPHHHEHKRHSAQVVDRSAGLGSRSSIFTSTNSLITAASSMMFDSKSAMLGSVKSLMSAGSSAPVEQASRKAILEGPHQQSSYAPARVRMITDDTSIMVAPDERTWTKHNLHWCSYMILRKDTVKRMGKEDRSDASETYVNSAPVSYQPGNAAELFQWEVESAQKNEQILKTLEMDIQENMERINSGKDFSSDSTAKMLIGKKVVDIMRKEKELLTKEYAAFCEVFVGLRDRSYLMMAFRGWKVETSIKEDMITGRPAWRGGKGSYPSKSPVVVPSHGTSSQSARETALEALKRLTERTRTLHSKAGPGREGRDGRVGLGKDGTEGPGEEAASSPPMANDELQPTGSGAELDKVDKPPNSERRDLPTEMRARASGKSRPQPPSNSYDFSDEEDPEVNPTSVEMIETADSRRSIEVVGSADKPEEPKKLTLWW